MAVSGKQRKINERSLANLRQFPPGVSGNPNGRPKGRTLLEAIRDHLAKGGNLDASALAFVKELKRGSAKHAKEILDREEGAPDQHLTIEVIYRDRPSDAVSDN